MKIWIIFLLLLISACSEQAIQDNQNIPDNTQVAEPGILDKVSNERSFASETKIVGTKSDIRNSINSELTIYRKTENDQPILLFDFESENLARDPIIISPKDWKGYIYFAKKNLVHLQICELGSKDQTLYSSYCFEEENLDKNYFNQTIWIIYTTQSDLKIYDNSILDIMRFDNTHVYKTLIPKE